MLIPSFISKQSTYIHFYSLSTSPPQITSSHPSHPANSFYYRRLKHLPPIAKVMLTKIKKTNQIISLLVEPTESNLLPTGNEIEDQLISKSEEQKYSHRMGYVDKFKALAKRIICSLRTNTSLKTTSCFTLFS